MHEFDELRWFADASDPTITPVTAEVVRAVLAGARGLGRVAYSRPDDRPADLHLARG